MTPSRLAPFTHPLASLFDVAVDSLGAALAPESTRQYRSTARNFLAWLGAKHPEVVSLDQLRRDPHVLGWMAALRFFLLLRHTGMRVGEGVDLACDCLHASGPDHWTIHVPLGKLKTERMVPVDSFTRDLVHRLRFFRWLDPSPPDGRLLAQIGRAHV